MGLSYFTASLWQSLQYNQEIHGVRSRVTSHGSVQEHSDFVTVSNFVAFLAQRYPHRLAIGSPVLGGEVEHLTFRELQDVVGRTAAWLEKVLPRQKTSETVVALISASSITFAVTWLALLQSGHTVLLIAPQNTVKNVRHLLSISKSSALLYDCVCAPTASAGSENAEILRIELPWLHLADLTQISSELAPRPLNPRVHPDDALDIAYYFHSTGTTGPPKLIPQTHHGAVGVLPLLQGTWKDNDHITSTFTTTPLYHGGIADLFRSWSAAAPLWIFPENTVRLSGKSLMECIQAADQFSMARESYIANLSCVPFVLEMLLDDASAHERLAAFERVGVGGAAMPNELGNCLVSKGVKLLSRFGSSECGFLLSSDRDYSSDQNWNLLHDDEQANLFQRQSDGLYELVVPEKWPAVSTASHARRPFHTKDIFRKAMTGWQYAGRGDAQLTLATGKKLDPLRMENALRLDHSISEALVVGEGRTHPGLLIILAQTMQSNDFVVKETAFSAVQRINSQLLPHERVQRNMIKVLERTAATYLKKDVKGAIARKEALQVFQQDIDELYRSTPPRLDQHSSSREIKIAVANIVLGQLTTDESGVESSNIFQLGLDSSACMQIRSQFQTIISTAGLSGQVALSTIYELESVDKLSVWLEQALKGEFKIERTDRDDHAQKISQMQVMAERMKSLSSAFLQRGTLIFGPKSISKLPKSKGKVVLLTGSTGFLGSHILAQLLHDPSVSRIILLVRKSIDQSATSTITTAFDRVSNNLEQRGLSPLPKDSHVDVLLSDFGRTDLGLEPELYESLAVSATHLIHAAWDVNFNLPLSAFEPQLEGLVHLCSLLVHRADQSRKRFVFCSSTAVSTILAVPDLYQVKILPSTGYAQSKLLAEHLLNSVTALDVTTLRIGQLCGDTVHGIWNNQEAWPLMVDAGFHAVPSTGSKLTGRSIAVFPDLATIGNSSIDWLPVDAAAEQVLQKSFDPKAHTRNNELAREVSLVANTARSVSWGHFQGIVKTRSQQEYGIEVEFIATDEWLMRLEKVPWHPAQSLIPLWKENWIDVNRHEANNIAVETPLNMETNWLNDDTLWAMVKWIVQDGRSRQLVTR